jgi:hypothetical protein
LDGTVFATMEGVRFARKINSEVVQGGFVSDGMTEREASFGHLLDGVMYRVPP